MCGFIAATLLIVHIGIAQVTVYVSPTGSDTSRGTIDQPFRTIVKAHSVAIAGDTILVRGGTYVVNATINLSKSG